MYYSITGNIFRGMVAKLALAFKNSKTFKILSLAGKSLARWLDSSAAWRLIKAAGKIQLYWRNSSACRIVQRLTDFLLGLAKRIWLAAGRFFESSVVIRVISFAGERQATVVCILILLFAIVPHDLWRNQYLTLASILAAMLYLLKTTMDERYYPDLRKLDFTLAVFVLTAFLAAFTSITPSESARTLVLYMTSILFGGIIALSVKTKEEVRLVQNAIIAAAAFTSLYGIWQYINRVPVDPLLVDISVWKTNQGRIFSTMENPNNYAEFLILSLPFFGSAFFNARKTALKVVIALFGALALANLALTYSRACYMGFLVSIIVFLLFKNWKYVPVLVLLGPAMFPLLPASVVDRMRNLGKDTSVLYRVDIWKGSFLMLKHYWTTGIGLGTEPFMRLFRSYSTTVPPVHSHMFVLQLGLEFGIIGLMSFVWFIGSTVKKAVRRIFRDNGWRDKNVAIACISSLAGIFTAGVVEYIWFYPRVMTYFWVVVGLFLAVLELKQEQGEKSV